MSRRGADCSKLLVQQLGMLDCQLSTVCMVALLNGLCRPNVDGGTLVGRQRDISDQGTTERRRG